MTVYVVRSWSDEHGSPRRDVGAAGRCARCRAGRSGGGRPPPGAGPGAVGPGGRRPGQCRDPGVGPRTAVLPVGVRRRHRGGPAAGAGRLGVTRPPRAADRGRAGRVLSRSPRGHSGARSAHPDGDPRAGGEPRRSGQDPHRRPRGTALRRPYRPRRAGRRPPGGRGDRRLRHLGPRQPARRGRASGGRRGSGRSVAGRATARRSRRRPQAFRRHAHPRRRHGPLGGQHPAGTRAAARGRAGHRDHLGPPRPLPRPSLRRGDADGLPARGLLGSALKAAVSSGAVHLIREFTVSTLTPPADGTGPITVTGSGRDGEAVVLQVDTVAVATGSRPDLDLLREVRLELDPALEAPARLAPLIDPNSHSCGTVPPHGEALLAHPDEGFYVVGMKSYGRAPTFLLATGYEQVRSIAAALAGDTEAAERVELHLPSTGVCSTDLGARETAETAETSETAEASSCGT